MPAESHSAAHDPSPPGREDTRAATAGNTSAATRPVIYINLWAQGGMKHYSEALVHALAPACPILYVRNHASSQPVEALRVRLEPASPRGLGDLWRLVRTILERRPRAIHVNSELPILLPLFPFFAFFNTIITLHDAVPHEGESLAKRAFMRLHLLMIFLFIRKVIVHSTVIRAQLPAWLQAKACVLPLINFQVAAREQQPPPKEGPFTVLFFGRLLPYKGLDYLLAAFRLLDPAKFALLIAGEGDLPKEAFEMPNIRIIQRFIADEELPTVFNQAHVAALPYIAASQSGVAFLAFAFERPVISTRVGALAEVITDDFNGFLVEPRSPEQLAAALQRISEPATFARLVENVRKQNVSADEEIRTKLLAVYDVIS